MSGSNDLNVRITATDTTATTTVKQLRDTIRSAEQTIQSFNAEASKTGNNMSAVAAATVAAMRQIITESQAQIAAIKATENAARTAGQVSQQAAGATRQATQQVTAAIEEQTEAQIRLEAAIKSVTSAQTAQATQSRRQIEVQETVNRFAGVRSPNSGAAVASAAVFAEPFLAEERAIQKATAAMDRQIGRALVLRETLNMPAAPIAMRANNAMPAVPAFLSKQKNASGEIASAAAVMSQVEGGALKATTNVNRLTASTRHLVALFDEGMSGRRGQMFSTLGAAARDAGLGVAGLATSIAVLVASAVVGGIMHAAESLGKWATEARAAASATGMTLEAYTALQGSLRSMGLSTSEADASLRKLAENMSKAVAEPTSQAAQAFHNLGISQEQLIATNGNTAAGLRLIAEAFTHTADGANKTANMNEILGRGFEKLIPLLQNGGVGLDEMAAKQKELGNVLDESGAKKLEMVRDAVSELGEKIRSQGIKAMEDWAPAIIGLMKWFGALGAAVSAVSSAISAMFAAASSGEAAAMAQIGVDQSRLAEYSNPGAKPKAMSRDPKELYPDQKAVPALTPRVSPLESMQDQMAMARLAATQSAKTAAEARAKAEASDLSVMEQTLAKKDGLTAKETDNLRKQIDNKREQMRLQTLPATAKSGADDAAESAALKAGQGIKDPKQQRIAENQAYIASLQQSAQAAGLEARERESIEKEITARKLALLNEQTAAEAAAAKKGASEAKRAAHQSYEDFAGAEKMKVAEAQGDMTKIKQIYDEWAKMAATVYKQPKSVVEGIQTQETKTLNVDKLRAIRESKQDEEAANNQDIVMGRANAIGANKGQVSASKDDNGAQQTTAQLAAMIALVQARLQQQVATLNEVVATSAKGSDEQKEASREIVATVTRAKQQEVDLYNKAAEQVRASMAKTLAPITEMFDKIGSGFESLGDDIIKATIAPQKEQIKQGLTTIKLNTGGVQMKAAFDKFATSMISDGVKSIETAASKMLAQQIGSMIGVDGAGGLGSLLANGVGKLFGVGAAAAAPLAGAAANVAAGAGGSAATAAPITAAVAASATTISASQVTAAGTIVTAMAANNALLVAAIESTSGVTDVELAALNAKPSILGFTYSQGGVVPSAAGGMVVGGMGDGAQMSILHAREMVLPQHLSRGIQSIIDQSGGVRGQNGNRGGNSANLNYSPTINTGGRGGRSGTGMTRAEFSQAMAAHGGAMMGEARNMVRSGFRA